MTRSAPSLIPGFPELKDEIDRSVPTKATDVVTDNFTHLTATNKTTLAEFGAKLVSEFIETMESLDPTFDGGRGKYLVCTLQVDFGADILYHLREYLSYRINRMFLTIHPETKMRLEFFDGDDKLVWTRHDTKPPTRFAGMIMVKPGSLDESSLKPIMATSDDEERRFIDEPLQSELLSASAKGSS
jgi:hypothetical protein